MQFSLERVRRGENTIAVTGNVLRDYLTDLFPILELGTSARMLSIVPLLNGGGLFETGAGGSAAQARAAVPQRGTPALGLPGRVTALWCPPWNRWPRAPATRKAAVLARTLDQAIGSYLENARYPSRKVNEIDNRGSTFYLTLYWAQALAAQTDDADLQARFTPVAEALAKDAETIARRADGRPGITRGHRLATTTRIRTSAPGRCDRARPSTRSSTRCRGVGAPPEIRTGDGGPFGRRPLLLHRIPRGNLFASTHVLFASRPRLDVTQSLLMRRKKIWVPIDRPRYIVRGSSCWPCLRFCLRWRSWPRPSTLRSSRGTSTSTATC